MTLPGVQVTYQGEELGMVNNMDISWEEAVDPSGCNCGVDEYLNERCSRDPERTPMQWNKQKNAGFSNASKTWLPVNKNYVTLNAEDQKHESNSHMLIYKDLVSLRNSYPAFSHGDIKTSVEGNVFALRRMHSDSTKDVFVTAVNFGNSATSVNLSHFSETLDQGIVEISTTKSSTGYERNPIKIVS